MSSSARLSLALVGCTLLLCCEQTHAQSGPRSAGKRAGAALPVKEVIYRQGLQENWQDFGWANRKPNGGGPELLDLTNYAGWILARPGLSGDFGGLRFRFNAPRELGDFLEVRVDSTQAQSFPRIKVGPAHCSEQPQGWTDVFIAMDELNPNLLPFDRVVIRAFRPVPAGWIQIDEVGLTATDPSRPKAATGVHRENGPTESVAASIDCRAKPKPISPLIYGIALVPRKEKSDTHQWQLGATARRWGGNPSSRYNWELGNAWNTGSDYFFRNINYVGGDYSYTKFLDDDRDFKVQSALTVPMLGWVARDTRSFAFPVDEFGEQQQVDGELGAGNGLRKNGKKIEPGGPGKTSVAAPPEFIGRWVGTIADRDRKNGGARSVAMYILDNEPMLWHDTHRDVHPQPASYDELLSKTIAYGTAVRKADPKATIAGPAEWGWINYINSAVDSEAGVQLRPDRRGHGDVPLIAWYLKKLKEHEKKTGVKILDVVDLHYYPQAKGVGEGEQGRMDPEAAALRIRSTRSLWDPSYKDESWIDEKIMLIPRMKQWIAENYPGLGISIGEYNFGAEQHISGGLAEAEVLGRFGQNDVTSAFYWTYPAKDSPAFHAFRAYRNYDGKGAHFLDYSLPTRPPENVSLFASTDESGKKVVAVALNLDPRKTFKAKLDLPGCAPVQSKRVFTYAGDPRGLVEIKPTGKPGDLEELLAPYSITVIELTLAR